MAEETPEEVKPESAEETNAEAEMPESESAEPVVADELPVELEKDAAPVAESPATDVAEEESEGAVAGLTLGSGTVNEEEEKPAPVIRGRIDKFGVAMGTGRRKTSVARVRVKEGSGEWVINGRSIEDYFTTERDRLAVQAPLKAVERDGKVDIWVRVHGGGTTGQAGAIILGIARALQVLEPELHHSLSEGGYLTRDGRMVERKKYGYKKARKSFQFSKR